MEKKLYRKEYDKILGGVSSGLADYLSLDVAIVRLIFILLTIFGFSGVLIYIVLWIILPAKKIPDIISDYRVYEEKAADTARAYAYATPKKKSNGRMIAGGILIALGLYFLFYEFNFIPYWFSIGKLWPLVLIIPGLIILFNTKKKNTRESDNKATIDPEPQKPTDNNSDEPVI